jgi:hypothetical protein
MTQRAQHHATLDDLRLLPDDETDLRWLFCQSDGELGLRSWLGGMIDRHNAGTTAHKGSVALGLEGDGADQRQAEAAERAGRIQARLRALPRAHQRVLFAHYGPGLPPMHQRPLAALDDWATLVLLIAERAGVGRRELEGLCLHSLLPEAERPEAKRRLDDLRRRAEVALVQACRAYRAQVETV